MIPKECFKKRRKQSMENSMEVPQKRKIAGHDDSTLGGGDKRILSLNLAQTKR
jgi:hypothetical protein